MKKIINSILAFVTLFSVTSCDLDMDPETAIRPEDAYTMEYCEGVRGYAYVDLKALLSGGFYSIPDLYVDVLNVCIGSGNQGIYPFNWRLYPTDQDVTSFWSSYYTTMMHINYAIRHMDAAYEYLTPDEQKKVDVYKGEMYFFRAYVMHRAALLFCEDYDPDKAADQLGLPYPKEWDPEAKLARGTLAKLYENVEADLVEAEKTVTAQGTPTDQIYLTKDAITAFRAELALHLHQYTEASQYAQSLYGTYPLVTTAEGLERMWREDTSTENILQLEVLRTTMTTVNSFGSYLNSSWEPNLGEYFYAPTIFRSSILSSCSKMPISVRIFSLLRMPMLRSVEIRGSEFLLVSSAVTRISRPIRLRWFIATDLRCSVSPKCIWSMPRRSIVWTLLKVWIR